MAKVDISVDGTEVQVNLTSPVLEFDIDTPQLVLPITGTGDGVPGAPGPPGPQGPAGPPPWSTGSVVWNAGGIKGDTGVINCTTAPLWAQVGLWAYATDSSQANNPVVGWYRITGVSTMQLSFDSWTPA